MGISEINNKGSAAKGGMSFARIVRLVCCGAIDDGKSTLIARLLHDTGSLYKEQKNKIDQHTSDKELAFLLDSLQEEREGGITVDVGYRHFRSPKRRYILADTPGHGKFLPNMVTGASLADIALLVIDASLGLRPPSKQHLYLLHLLAIENLLVVVNKMDMVGYDEARFAQIKKSVLLYTKQLSFKNLCCIPIAAKTGENIVTTASHMPWAPRESLLEKLENWPLSEKPDAPFIFPITHVYRNAKQERLCGGMALSGYCHKGGSLRLLPGGDPIRVEKITLGTQCLDVLHKDRYAMLSFAKDAAPASGDIAISAECNYVCARQYRIMCIWFDDKPLYPGRDYIIQTHNRRLHGHVSFIKCKIDVTNLGEMPARTIQKNDIALVNIDLHEDILFLPYKENRLMGSFIFIDTITHRTVGAATVLYPLRRSLNVVSEKSFVSKKQRSRQKGQSPCVLWLTGLSGAGKSTIAGQVDAMLFAKGYHCATLDGDNLRKGLCADLGFVESDRIKNIRRVAEVARLMLESGLIVIISLISPFAQERKSARALFATNSFFEIFVDTPLKECIRRDPKGLYKKALNAEIRNFTAFESRYEAPLHPDIHINTLELSADAAALKILDHIAPFIKPS